MHAPLPKPQNEILILTGDCRAHLATINDESFHCVVTSPPYWGLRNYGVAGQIGLEKSFQDYIAKMVEIFRDVRRVLRKDGTLWLNLGDSYASTNAGNRNGLTSTLNSSDKRDGSHRGKNGNQYRDLPEGLKSKDLCGIPWRVAFALQADGWYLRQDIIWHKPNPMPESVRDRCTKSHEYIFLLSKSEKYYFDAKAIKEPIAAASAKRYAYKFKDKRSGSTKGLRQQRECQPRGELVPVRVLEKPMGRNARSVWTIVTKSYKGAHFATFPPALIAPCILAGCPKGGMVLDPFGGAGTTGLVADRLGRNAILIEINPAYVELAEQRIRQDALTRLTPPI